MDDAEKGMKDLGEVLEDLYSGMFNIKDMGFMFSGNAAFVLVNLVDNSMKNRMSIKDDKIEDDSRFKKYFNLAGVNLNEGSQKYFSHYFRLK